jgi:hypothetical protein
MSCPLLLDSEPVIWQVLTKIGAIFVELTSEPVLSIRVTNTWEELVFAQALEMLSNALLQGVSEPRAEK